MSATYQPRFAHTNVTPHGVSIALAFHYPAPAHRQNLLNRANPVTGNPPVTHDVAVNCPCQINQHLVLKDPSWSKEEKEQFWAQLHLIMPDRDPAEFLRRQEEEREYNARSWRENRAIDPNPDKKVEADMRTQREGGETAAESSAKRVERDRQS